ncbi:hypothetical protein [Yinghuangia soli]|uniref:Uncharacterized protein n=1 Tax=Yinghuangia soli TaxID=2908204 RepID=A0AA41PUN7_9ACTN|nr:hypothetical protein [Yinghuangia soli]MCF2526193.1 hypothetical protein [Yinghuangia soli]
MASWFSRFRRDDSGGDPGTPVVYEVVGAGVSELTYSYGDPAKGEETRVVDVRTPWREEVSMSGLGVLPMLTVTWAPSDGGPPHTAEVRISVAGEPALRATVVAESSSASFVVHPFPGA